MRSHLLYPFLVYRSLIFPFFVASLVAVPCWLVFRFYRLRDPAHRLSVRREILLLAVVLYFSGLASATLAPNDNSRSRAENAVAVDLRPSLASLTCSSPMLPPGSRDRFFCMYNARGNVLLFVPLGILLPLTLRRLRLSRGMLIALAVSVTVELLQYVSRAWGSYRLADINDVILNVLGAALGLAVGFLLRWGLAIERSQKEKRLIGARRKS